MNLEEIKNLLLEKKKYLVIILIIIVGFLVLKKSDEGQVNSNQIMENKIEKSSKTEAQSNANTNNVNTENIEADKTVTVDISGAVKKQGVYTLHHGARINELIQAAGGLKSNAQLKNINRAIMLKDQDKIHIPYKGEKMDVSAPATNSVASGDAQTSSSDSGETININTATVADLQKLNGIGEKKAEQIIAYREQKGQFKKIEDLMQVSGIGEKTFAALKDKLAI